MSIIATAPVPGHTLATLDTAELPELDIDQDEAAEPARPWWLTEPCPAWCELNGWHSPDAFHEDRAHIAAAYEDHELPLTLMPASRRHGGPQVAYAQLHQHVDHVAPRIQLTVGDAGEAEFTLEEAQAIADQLAALVRMARGEVTR